MRGPAFVIMGAILGAASWAQAQEAAVDAETKAVCAEAEERFAAAGGTKDPGKVTVLMYKYRFCPPNVTVKAGAAVRWVNVDKRTSHSVWFKEAGQAETERLFNMESHEISFAAPGKYPYLCGPHWDQEKMVGHVTVVP